MSKTYAIAAIVGTLWLAPPSTALPEKAVTIDGKIQSLKGSAFQYTVTIQFDIADGWHIYEDAGEGAEVSTSLEVDLPDGVKVLGNWRRPMGHEGATIGAMTLDGKVKFSRDIAVSDGSRGEAFEVKIQYQACTDEFCNPPQSKIVSLTIPSAPIFKSNLFDAPVRIASEGKFLNEDAKTRFLSPAISDVDGDGSAELILGCLRGDVWLHRDLNSTDKGDPLWGPRERLIGASGKPIKTSNW